MTTISIFNEKYYFKKKLIFIIKKKEPLYINKILTNIYDFSFNRT